MSTSLTSPDPMAQFLDLVAQARAARVIREFEAQEKAALSGTNTESGEAPAETPRQETRHGTT